MNEFDSLPEGFNVLSVLLGSLERAPWGWGIFIMALALTYRFWPVFQQRLEEARRAKAQEDRTENDILIARVSALETKLEIYSNRMHSTEIKLVSVMTAYRLIAGELERNDPNNPVLRQARALLNAPMPNEEREASMVFATEMEALDKEPKK